MGTNGYECRRCGYSPSDRELQGGSCPHCAESRHFEKIDAIRQMNSLPLGGVVDVNKSHVIIPREHKEDGEDPSKKTWWTTSTIARFLCVEVHRDGTRVFANVEDTLTHEGRDCFDENQRGTGTVRSIPQRVLKIRSFSQWMPPALWTPDEVFGWYTWERTYGAYLTITDCTPSPASCARQRILEGVGASL